MTPPQNNQTTSTLLLLLLPLLLLHPNGSVVDVDSPRGACVEAEGMETRFSIYALKISLFLETPGSCWIPMEQYGRFKRLLRVYETRLRVMLLVMLIVTG